MGIVGRRDRYKIDTVFAIALSFKHFLPVSVGSIRGNSKRLRVGTPLFGVYIQSASGKLK